LYPTHDNNLHVILNDGSELKIDLSIEGVPHNAFEVVIFTYTKSGNVGSINEDGQYIFYTSTDNGQIERYLFYHAYRQDAWSYNSENIALPLDKEHYVFVKIDRAAHYNIKGFVKGIGYRKST